MQITIRDIDRSNRIWVTAAEVNYANRYAEIEQGIQELKSEILEMGNDLPECSVKHDGPVWHEVGCGVEDDRGNSLCPVDQQLCLRQELELLKREDWQLQNCWRSSLGQGKYELLEDASLIHRYRSVRQLTVLFNSANHPS